MSVDRRTLLGGRLSGGGVAENLDVVAYHDLDGRPGKLTSTERDGRWYPSERQHRGMSFGLFA